jgi:hypothetical protein
MEFAKLYSFIWAIPRRLNVICRRFGTHCSILVGGVNRKINRDELVGVYKWENIWLKKAVMIKHALK